MPEDVDFPLPYLATSILFMVSTFGFVISFYLLVKFLTRKGRLSSFQKLCLAKTFPNVIVCSSFLLWVIPLSIIQPLEVSRLPNVVVGQVAGAGAYIMGTVICSPIFIGQFSGPLIQLCMSANRCFILYFPLKNYIVDKRSSTNLAISVAIIVSIIFTCVGLPDECGYIYDPKVFTWTSESYSCAEFQLNVLLCSVFTLAIMSNSLNFITAMKLLFCNSFELGMNQAYTSRRRRRRIMMFIQNVVQDCLHMVDLINCIYISLLSNDLWFQFTFLTLSFVLVYALDGLVMFHFHPELQPKFMRRRQTSIACKPVFTVL
ncbi:Protein CBG11461 [Caenorhabditis briggsae]|uniref:Protein CBG11461 n=2 Tax=Caenorhabditis briggsae TaxID=6238 RepID=A8XCY7_CAEBR|nr:Protein CBG11461 [Caenorhabditis briggsae]CAP30505.2 Protein CBG11461 [Caenorhabditis briggsae]